MNSLSIFCTKTVALPTAPSDSIDLDKVFGEGEHKATIGTGVGSGMVPNPVLTERHVSLV